MAYRNWVGFFVVAFLATRACAAPMQPHYHLVRTLPLAGNLGWDYLALDSLNSRLYVTREDHVDVFDVDSGLLVGQIPQTLGVHGVALDIADSRGWISDGQTNTVTVFDMNTLTPIATIPVGTRPDCIIFEPATNRVFTFNGGSDDATAIDANTNKVLGTIPLGGRPEYAAPDGVGMIYDNLADTSQIVAIDARTLTVKSHWPLAPVTDPSGLAMDVINRHLFSVGHNGKMAVLDADTGKVIATPTIGQGPDAARFDLGYEVALSSNGRDGTLTVVQEQTPQVFTPIQTVTTQVGARTMAFDTVTHDLWLITAQFIPVPPGSPANTRPAIQNGTVVLLEFAPTP